MPDLTSLAVSFFFEGDDYFRSLQEAMEAAQESIDIELYYFASDPIGWRFAEILSRKAYEGVKIRLLYDSMGCIGTSDELFTALDHAGIDLKAYHPLLELGSRIARRNHRKFFVIDGRLGFLGGYNLASEYSASTYGPKAWRDSGVRTEEIGAVTELVRVFERSWMGRKQRTRAFLKGRVRLRRPKGEPIFILANFGWRRKNLIREEYLRAIAGARRNIWITNSYFIPDGGVRMALQRAARRGVEVRLITAGESDVTIARWASQAVYGRLLKAGVRILEYKGRILHAKSATVDGEWYTVGTANLDHLSFFKNLEVNLFGNGEDNARALDIQFKKDLKSSREILWREWKKRSRWQRFRERFFYWFRAWM